VVKAATITAAAPIAAIVYILLEILIFLTLCLWFLHRIYPLYANR
jgi:hypothetical protein